MISKAFCRCNVSATERPSWHSNDPALLSRRLGSIFTGIHPFLCGAGDLSAQSFGLVWFGLSLTMLPHLPFYLSFICSFVSQYPLVCPISRLILWSAVTSECQSEPLVLALILAVSVAAELLWTVADGWREVAQG